MVSGLGFRGLRGLSRVWALGLEVEWFRVEGLGFGVSGLGASEV